MFHNTNSKHVLFSTLLALGLGGELLAQSSLRVHTPIYKSNPAGSTFSEYKLSGKDAVRITVRLYEDAAANQPVLDEFGQPWSEELIYRIGSGQSEPESGLHVLPAGGPGGIDLVLGASRGLPPDLGYYSELCFTTQVTRLSPKSGLPIKFYAECPAQVLGQAGASGPMGPKGEQGAVGPEGPAGPPGEKGTDGGFGQKGDKGDKGDKGLKGDKGDIGPKGDKGDKGLKGDKGNQGDAAPKTRIQTLKLASQVGTAGPNWTKLSTIGSFTKSAANTQVELQLNVWLEQNHQLFTDEQVFIALRIDDQAATWASFPVLDSGSGRFEVVSMTGIFDNLPAGAHTVSFWARSSGGFVGLKIAENATGIDDTRLLVKEFY